MILIDDFEEIEILCQIGVVYDTRRPGENLVGVVWAEDAELDWFEDIKQGALSSLKDPLQGLLMIFHD